MPTNHRPQNPPASAWRLYALASEWVLGTLGLGALGWWIDAKYGSFPWWTLGLGVGGAVGGLANLIRSGLRSFKQEQKLDEQEKRNHASRRS